MVTGASSGVGYALTRRLAEEEGAHVLAVARRRVFRLEALVKQVGEEHLSVMTADLAAPGQAEEIAEFIGDVWGGVDGFVHGVNRSLRRSALDVTDDEFDLTMQVNVKSALYGVQALAPFMRAQAEGAIVIYNPTPARTEEFAASEAVTLAASSALSALCDGWARQLEGYGVSVQEVAPAPVEECAQGRAAHETLLLETLRCALQRPSAPPLPLLKTPEELMTAPLILSARNGLSLAQF